MTPDPFRALSEKIAIFIDANLVLPIAKAYLSACRTYYVPEWH